MPRAEKQEQQAFNENVVADSDLEGLLEEREDAKEGKRLYKEIDGKVRERIKEKGYGKDGDVRVGRFVVGMRPVPARSVEFETAASTRIVIMGGDPVEASEPE
jgi:hypothetical protein